MKAFGKFDLFSTSGRIQNGYDNLLNTSIEAASRKRKGKREFLNDIETQRMTRKLEKPFELKVKIPLMRHGKSQRIETLINEEAITS